MVFTAFYSSEAQTELIHDKPRYHRRFYTQHTTIANLDILHEEFERSKLLIYGETHSARENASVIYILVRTLGTKRIAIESPISIKSFINSVIQGDYDYTLHLHAQGNGEIYLRILNTNMPMHSLQKSEAYG